MSRGRTLHPNRTIAIRSIEKGIRNELIIKNVHPPTHMYNKPPELMKEFRQELPIWMKEKI